MNSPSSSSAALRAVLERLATLPATDRPLTEVEEGLLALDLFFTLSPEEQAAIIDAGPMGSVTTAELGRFERRLSLSQAAMHASLELPSRYGAGGAVLAVARTSAGISLDVASRALGVEPARLIALERGDLPWTALHRSAIEAFCHTVSLAAQTLVRTLRAARDRELPAHFARLSLSPGGAALFREVRADMTPPEELRAAIEREYEQFFAPLSDLDAA